VFKPYYGDALAAKNKYPKTPPLIKNLNKIFDLFLHATWRSSSNPLGTVFDSDYTSNRLT